MESEKKGIAIQFGIAAPKIIAVARGKLLVKLLEIARKNNITVYRDSDLTEILSTLKVGTEIPEDLFTAVSRILAYCYRINIDFREKMRSIGI